MDPVAPEVAARFASLLDAKRRMLKALARDAAQNVKGARDRGETITEDLLAQEEYARRLEASAEALGSSELPTRTNSSTSSAPSKGKKKAA